MLLSKIKNKTLGLKLLGDKCIISVVEIEIFSRFFKCYAYMSF